MSTWEYTRVTTGTTPNALGDLDYRLSALGSLGWEVCGMAAADPTIGVNQYTVLLKRQTLGFAFPAGTEPAWHPDPAGRFALRWWDGLRWTEHVTNADRTQQDTDYPNRR